MSTPLIHIVGGGFNQIAIVQTAKQLGFQVLVTDINSSPPAKQFADFYESIDTVDKEKTLACAQRYNINAIVTDQSDVAVPTVAYIAEKLGLLGIGYEIALQFTDKYKMRSTLKQKGLAKYLPAESLFFSDPDAACQFCARQQTINNFLVKPINSQGSKGVSRLNNDFKNLITVAFRESINKGILIETYIDGEEYSVEAFVKDGEVYNLAIAKKYQYQENRCLDEANTFLDDVNPTLEAKLFDTNTDIIKNLALPFGSTHAEYKVFNNKVYLMEIAARGAGGCINSDIVPFLTEFSPLESLLKLHKGEAFNVAYKNYRQRYAILRFYNFPAGKIQQIIINNEICQTAAKFFFQLKVGDDIRPIKDSRDRPGYFIIFGNDKAEVLRTEKLLISAVKIKY